MLNRGRDDYAYTLVDVGATDAALLLEAVADKLRAKEDIIRVRVIKNQEVGY